MEKTYNKEQLIKAMAKYNALVLANPSEFTPSTEITSVDEAAVEQVECLLYLVDVDTLSPNVAGNP